jgi:hypothetical protein
VGSVVNETLSLNLKLKVEHICSNFSGAGSGVGHERCEP